MAMDRDEDDSDRDADNEPARTPRYRDDEDRDLRDRPRVPQTNGMATASLVLGVLSLCGGLTALPGLICGIIGIGRASSRGGAGHGMAIAGTVLSGIGMLSIIPLLIGLLLPAVQKVRQASERMSSSNNLKQIGLAMHIYNDSHDHLPLPYSYTGPRDGEPSALSDRLSWRVAMLPYMEQNSLYAKFQMAEPWNSPTNLPHSKAFVKTLIHPSDGMSEPTSRYRIFYGGGAVYDLGRPARLSSIADGSSTTIAVVEGGERVTWSQFDEYPFSMDGPLPKLGHDNFPVIQVAMFDGSVRAIRKSIDPMVLKSGIHASDGLPLGE